MIGYGLDVAERYRNLPYIAEYAGHDPSPDPTAAPARVRTPVAACRR